VLGEFKSLIVILRLEGWWLLSKGKRVEFKSGLREGVKNWRTELILGPIGRAIRVVGSTGILSMGGVSKLDLYRLGIKRVFVILMGGLDNHNTRTICIAHCKLEGLKFSPSSSSRVFHCKN